MVIHLFSQQSLSEFAYVLATVLGKHETKRRDRPVFGKGQLPTEETNGSICLHFAQAEGAWSERQRWLRGPRSIPWRRPAFVRWAAGRDGLGRARCLLGCVLGAQ